MSSSHCRISVLFFLFLYLSVLSLVFYIVFFLLLSGGLGRAFVPAQGFTTGLIRGNPVRSEISRDYE